MYDRSSIHEGMTARSADGEELGAVRALSDRELEIAHGDFFPRGHVVRFDDIREIRDGEVWLSQDAHTLRGLRDRKPPPGEEATAEELAPEARELREREGGAPTVVFVEEYVTEVVVAQAVPEGTPEAEPAPRTERDEEGAARRSGEPQDEPSKTRR